jgi:hypothetical protein
MYMILLRFDLHQGHRHAAGVNVALIRTGLVVAMRLVDRNACFLDLDLYLLNFDLRHVLHPVPPPKRIHSDTLENIRERMCQLGGARPWARQLVVEHKPISRAVPCDRFDRNKCGRRANSKDFGKVSQFREMNLPLLDAPALGLRQLQHTITRHARHNTIAIRHRQHKAPRVRHGPHTHEARRRKLVDLALRCAVEVQRESESARLGLVAPADHGRVVSANLGVSRAARGCAVEALHDQRVLRARAHAVVCRGGRDVDGEAEFGGGGQRQVGVAGKGDRADVH